MLGSRHGKQLRWLMWIWSGREWTLIYLAIVYGGPKPNHRIWLDGLHCMKLHRGDIMIWFNAGVQHNQADEGLVETFDKFRRIWRSRMATFGANLIALFATGLWAHYHLPNTPRICRRKSFSTHDSKCQCNSQLPTITTLLLLLSLQGIKCTPNPVIPRSKRRWTEAEVIREYSYPCCQKLLPFFQWRSPLILVPFHNVGPALQF